MPYDLTESNHKLTRSAPLDPTPNQSGLKLVLELVAYRDGHTGIAVSRISGPNQQRTVRQTDALPLNSGEELHAQVTALIDRLLDEARSLPEGRDP
jgi:hypothetical protein